MSNKEIAYEMGFKDPNYYFRFFKEQTGQTPSTFKDTFNYQKADPILTTVLDLIEQYYIQETTTDFYADQANTSAKTLSRRLHEYGRMSLHQLLHKRKVQEGIVLLKAGSQVQEVAYLLGFKEPSHFSAYMRKQTGKTPSQIASQPERQEQTVQ